MKLGSTASTLAPSRPDFLNGLSHERKSDCLATPGNALDLLWQNTASDQTAVQYRFPDPAPIRKRSVFRFEIWCRWSAPCPLSRKPAGKATAPYRAHDRGGSRPSSRWRAVMSAGVLCSAKMYHSPALRRLARSRSRSAGLRKNCPKASTSKKGCSRRSSSAARAAASNCPASA
jgi:hypothetical protein